MIKETGSHISPSVKTSGAPTKAGPAKSSTFCACPRRAGRCAILASSAACASSGAVNALTLKLDLLLGADHVANANDNTHSIVVFGLAVVQIPNRSKGKPTPRYIRRPSIQAMARASGMRTFAIFCRGPCRQGPNSCAGADWGRMPKPRQTATISKATTNIM